MSAFSSDVLRSSSFLLCFDCHLRLRSLFLNTELHNCYFSTLAGSSKTLIALHIAQFCWLKHFPSPSVKSVYLQLKPVEKLVAITFLELLSFSRYRLFSYVRIIILILTAFFIFVFTPSPCTRRKKIEECPSRH